MWTLEQVVRYLKALTERRGPRGGVLAINEQGTIVARGQRAKDLLAAQERRGSKAEPEPKGRAKAAEKPGKKSKPSVADSMQTIRQLAETGGPKAQAKMEEIIASHTVSEIGDLKKMLGIRASGTKAVLVAKVAEKALAMMGKPTKSPAKPAAKPKKEAPIKAQKDTSEDTLTTGIRDVLDRHRRGEIDLEEAIEAMKQQFVPMANALAEVASHIAESVPKKATAEIEEKPATDVPSQIREAAASVPNPTDKTPEPEKPAEQTADAPPAEPQLPPMSPEVKANLAKLPKKNRDIISQSTVSLPVDYQDMKKAVYDAIGELMLYHEMQNGIVPNYRLYHELLQKYPDLSVQEFHQALSDLNQNEDIERHVRNEVRDAPYTNLAQWEDDRMYYFAMIPNRPGISTNFQRGDSGDYSKKRQVFVPGKGVVQSGFTPEESGKR